MVKNLPAMQETWVQSLGWEDPLGKEMATHSSILTWEISWIEEPGGLQSIGSQRVRHDLAAKPPPTGKEFSKGFLLHFCMGFPGGASGKEPACQET